MPKKAKERLKERDLLEPIEAIAKTFHVTVDEVLGRSRLKHIAQARHACWSTLRGAGWSYPAIGRLWDRDHSSVMSGVAKAMTRELAG